MSAAINLRRGRAMGAVATAIIALLGWGAAGAQAAPAQYEGSSTDGARVFFSTTEKILPAADKDNFKDIYQRAGTITSLVSFGPFGGNRPFNADYAGATPDGTHIYFTTDERLVQQDTDSTRDVYERTAGTTVLVSRGSTGGGDVTADFAAASADGSRVIFTTAEALQAGDTDGTSDIYARAGGATTLLTPGGSGAGVQFRAASADATRVFFVTSDSLVAADTDSALDIYESAGGSPVLVSGSPGVPAEADADFGTISTDGTHVFFGTSEPLVAEDTDNDADVYEHSGGATTLLSISATAGNGDFDAGFQGASADGSHAYFSTVEPLTAEDTDSQTDLYDAGPGGTVLASTSATAGNGAFTPDFNGSSADGSHVFFTTDEQLVGADTDSSQDIYVRSGGTTSLLSVGSVSGPETNAFFSANSADGTRVLFTTNETLVAEDTDSSADVYERSSGATTLVSTGLNETNGPFDASLGGTTPSLSHAFIHSGEHLTADDFDLSGDTDVFSRAGSTTALITAGNQTGPVVDIPTITGSIPGSPSSDETPMITGTAPSNSLVRLYATTNCTEETPIGAGTAQAFATTGIEITVLPNATTNIRATATDANGNISECSSTHFPYQEDSIAPAPPSITSTNPPSPANNNSPKVRGSAENNGTVRVFTNADCSGLPVATGSTASFATPGLTVSVGDNTTTSLTATVTDAAGNVSGCSAVANYVEDSTAAGTPILTSTTPPSPADDNTPQIRGTAPANSKVDLYKTADCSGSPAATGTAAELANPGIEVNVTNDSTTSIRAIATTQAGNVSPCSAPLVYVEDSTAPGAPDLTLGSRARSNDNRVVVSGQAAANALVYIFRGTNCQGTSIASGTAQQLASGITVTVADNTTVELHAVALDPAHNASQCSAPISYTEDSTRPKTRITFGPAFKTRDRTPTFRFLDETADPTTRFECKVDRKSFRRCKSPKTFKGLRPGRHTIRVRATDGAGNRGTTVKRRFKIVR